MLLILWRTGEYSYKRLAVARGALDRNLHFKRKFKPPNFLKKWYGTVHQLQPPAVKSEGIHASLKDLNIRSTSVIRIPHFFKILIQGGSLYSILVLYMKLNKFFLTAPAYMSSSFVWGLLHHCIYCKDFSTTEILIKEINLWKVVGIEVKH